MRNLACVLAYQREAAGQPGTRPQHSPGLLKLLQAHADPARLYAMLPLTVLPQRKLQGFDLWRTSFEVLQGSLVSAAHLLSSWAAEAATLAADWAMGLDAGTHLWQGAGFADSYLAAFLERVEQVTWVILCVMGTYQLLLRKSIGGTCRCQHMP